MFNASGSIFNIDEYQQQYQIEWETIGESVDVTTVTRQPYVWGEANQGYRVGTVVYRRGIITIHRQVLKIVSTGYQIVAEGSSQYIDFFPTNFPCQIGPTDPFKFHLDCAVHDAPEMYATLGDHWTDPDNVSEEETEWPDVMNDGTVIGTTSWLDVW